MSYVTDIAAYGFAICDGFVDLRTVDELRLALERADIDHLASQRAGKAFGIRNLWRATLVCEDFPLSGATGIYYFGRR